MYSLYDISNNGLYDLFVNGPDVQSINVLPRGVSGMHKIFVTGLKILSINVCPCDVRESVDVTPESDLTDLNSLNTESALNVLNSLNGIGLKSSQENEYVIFSTNFLKFDHF